MEITEKYEDGLNEKAGDNDNIGDNEKDREVVGTGEVVGAGEGGKNGEGGKVVNTRCGYGSCTPDCLQPCARPGALLAAMCFFVGLNAFVQMGLVNISLATWERRYEMQSSQAAWIIGAGELMSAVCGPLFGYMATFWHKGWMVTAAAVCMAIGNFFYVVPQFATGPYQLGASEAGGTCSINSNSTYDACVDDITDTNLSMWLGLFIVAQLFYGYTGSCMWTVGITYLDDNTKQENMPLTLGVFAGCAALGTTIGFIGGGISLEVYVDVFKVDMETIDIDSSDPRWVGAWWIGFGVALIASIPIVLIMACFPRELSVAVEYRKTKKSKAYKGRGVQEMEREDFGRTSRDLKHSLKTLLTNPVYVLLMFGAIVEMGAVTAFAAYLPKVLQFQFALTPSAAALVAGAVLVPGAIIGQLTGGIIAKCARLSVKGILTMQTVAAYICVLCSFGFLARCGMAPLAGFNADYPQNSSMTFADDFTQSCNQQCNCTSLVYEPICDTDGMSYFSPCHGACATEVELDDGTKMYGNCSCLDNSTSMAYQAEEGICPVDCSQFWIFMPLFLIMIICTFVESTAGFSATMRIVPEKQRAFAFGLQSPVVKLLGTVPFPILFGYVFDLSCEVWQDSCGEQGSCWIYDSATISLGLFIGGLVVKTFSGTCFLAATILYKPQAEDAMEIQVNVTDGEPGDLKHQDGFGEQVGDITKTDGANDGMKSVFVNNGFIVDPMEEKTFHHPLYYYTTKM